MKNILVTGGSRGIGKQIVRSCIDNEYNVHFTYAKDLSAAKEICNEINSKNLTFSKCDLNNVNEIIKLFKELKERFKFLDGLVNNAGISGGTNSIEMLLEKEMQNAPV